MILNGNCSDRDVRRALEELKTMGKTREISTNTESRVDVSDPSLRRQNKKIRESLP